MPELPEVETTLRGLLPYLTNQLIYSLTLRRRTLRWDIPSISKVVSQGIASLLCVVGPNTC